MARHTPTSQRAPKRARHHDAPIPPQGPAQDAPQGTSETSPPRPSAKTAPPPLPGQPAKPRGPAGARDKADSSGGRPSDDSGWLLAKGPARAAAVLSGATGVGLLFLAQDGRAFAPDQALALAFLAFLLAWRKSLTGWPVTTARVGARWGFALATLAALGAGTVLVLAGPSLAALPLGVWAVLLLVHAREHRA